MKKNHFLALCLSLFVVGNSFGWGKTGHRVVGQIAEWHLSNKALKNIGQILGPESLAMSANWMDEIRSDNAYSYTYTWHYLTVHEGRGYQPELQEKDGDAYEVMQKLIDELKNHPLSDNKKAENIRMLVHIVGDLHQPLHVGTGEDKGGNEVDVYYFNQKTNLHTVWDSKIIDHQQLSFTEWSAHLNRRADQKTVDKLQAAPFSQWLSEAVQLRAIVYNLPESKRLSYRYDYETVSIIEERLLAGGIRLAGILNDIYG
ncbi:endonuclease [Echinicola pacifica]|uniref:Endonuclease n=1 Tax=Echinicola pacifica TaxID=346377 RepID=A0A918PQH3_9BACT|nr:S1/P1 nuclease [Echinicola pacifica]GGZ18285.1 endonuclease [Echinicola pacifica]